MELNDVKCQRIIEAGFKRNDPNIRQYYNLNSIPVLPGIVNKDPAYWLELSRKYYYM